MSQLTKYFISFFLLATSAFTHQVEAHQQKEAISTILFNSRTGNLEVSHRFYIHDAEHAAKKLLSGQADLMKNQATQKAFADYVVAHFSLAVDQNQALPLKLLGYEVEGKFFWVYQEIATSITPKKLEITYDALMEVWPSQRNIVNIEGVGKLKSVELLASNSSKVVSF